MYTDKYMTSAEDLVEMLDGDCTSFLPDDDLDDLMDELPSDADDDLYADLSYDLDLG